MKGRLLEEKDKTIQRFQPYVVTQCVENRFANSNHTVQAHAQDQTPCISL